MTSSPWIGSRLRRSGNRWWDPNPQSDPDVIDGRSEWSKLVETMSPLWWWKADLNTAWTPVGDGSLFWPDETGHGYDCAFFHDVQRRRALIPSAAYTEYANVTDKFPHIGLGIGETDPVLFGATGSVLMVFQRNVPSPISTTSSNYFIERFDHQIYVWVDGTTQNLSLRAGVEVKDVVLKSEYNDGQPHVMLLRWNGSSSELWWDWQLRATANGVPAATSGYAWDFAAGGMNNGAQEVVRDDIVYWSRRISNADITNLQAAYNAPKPPRVGPVITWWDGVSEQPAVIEGWWDGTSIQPVVIDGWWDGTAIQPIQ